MTMQEYNSERKSLAAATAAAAVMVTGLCLAQVSLTSSFQPPHPSRTGVGVVVQRTAFLVHRSPSLSSSSSSSSLFSSVGGDGGPPNDDSDGNGEGGSEWDDFLNPNKKESDSLEQARAYMSEQSLPISFDTDEGILNDVTNNNNDDDDKIDSDNDDTATNNDDEISSSALANLDKQKDGVMGGISVEALAKNPYMKVVSNLSPSDLISKFTTTAHPRVQNAVRSTILGLIGSLPKVAFETTTVTTGQRLASLMFQLQMTGYMFKNAEYRLSLSQSLGMGGASLPSFGTSSDFLLEGSNNENAAAGEDQVDEDEDPLQGKVRGKIKVRYGRSSSSDGTTSSSAKKETNDESAAPATAEDKDTSKDNNNNDDDDGDDNGVDMDAGNKEKRQEETEESSSLEVEVDAAAYMSELRSEVDKLRQELTEKEEAKEEAIRKDLLLYIRTLPKQELRQLTNTISEDVLVAMKGLVNVVMAGIGEGQIGPETVTEQSGEAMAQLCMWQLVVGYNMRELEVREEMKSNLFASWDGDDDANNNDEGGVNFEPGTME